MGGSYRAGPETTANPIGAKRYLAGSEWRSGSVGLQSSEFAESIAGRPTAGDFSSSAALNNATCLSSSKIADCAL
jgi:hypothetical protein